MTAALLWLSVHALRMLVAYFGSDHTKVVDTIAVAAREHDTVSISSSTQLYASPCCIAEHDRSVPSLPRPIPMLAAPLPMLAAPLPMLAAPFPLLATSLPMLAATLSDGLPSLRQHGLCTPQANSLWQCCTVALSIPSSTTHCLSLRCTYDGMTTCNLGNLLSQT